jgi:hypothetical protein
LRAAFLRFDRPANAAKKKRWIAGLLAIGFGMVALFTAAAPPSARWQGILAALFAGSFRSRSASARRFMPAPNGAGS